MARTRLDKVAAQKAKNRFGEGPLRGCAHPICDALNRPDRESNPIKPADDPRRPDKAADFFIAATAEAQRRL